MLHPKFLDEQSAGDDPLCFYDSPASRRDIAASHSSQAAQARREAVIDRSTKGGVNAMPLLRP